MVNPVLLERAPYAVPALPEVDLDLRGNEGDRPDASLLEVLKDPALLRAYPDARPLESLLAARWDLAPEQCIVTAGADEALDRTCRAVLTPGREAILARPGFEMTERYVGVAGATTVFVEWPGVAFPEAELVRRVGPRTALIVLTSPNNPTGAVIDRDALRRIADAAPRALVLLDAAYIEFADEDLTAAALRLPNTLVVRTLSKAWGLAGLRVGYALGPARWIRWLRTVASPYPVASPSIALAMERLRRGDCSSFVAQVRQEREALLRAFGARAVPSQANFVFARLKDPEGFAAAMAERGIGVRTFPGRAGLDDAVRIACPGGPIERVTRAIREVLR